MNDWNMKTTSLFVWKTKIIHFATPLKDKLFIPEHNQFTFPLKKKKIPK